MRLVLDTNVVASDLNSSPANPCWLSCAKCDEVNADASHVRPALASTSKQRAGCLHLFVLEGRCEVVQFGGAQSDRRVKRKLAPVRYRGMHFTQYSQGLRRVQREG